MCGCSSGGYAIDWSSLSSYWQYNADARNKFFVLNIQSAVNKI